MAACKTCGVPVRWITSPNNRPQIVDDLLISAWIVTDRTKAPPGSRPLVLVGEDGTMRRGMTTPEGHEGAERIEGYLSHWATCTKPPARRKA